MPKFIDDKDIETDDDWATIYFGEDKPIKDITDKEFELSRFIKPPKQLVGGLYEPSTRSWERWIEICDWTGWDPIKTFRPMMYRGFVLPFSSATGMGTRIWNEWRWRINTQRPIRIIVVGEAGSGKTYMAIYIARVLEGMKNEIDKFTVDQIAFEREEYIRIQDELGPGRFIMLEETSYTTSARGWQNKEQKESVKIIESVRYLNNPIIIPVVNRNLLDKILREYYTNYVVEMDSRGIGRAYYTWHPQFKTKEKRKGKGRIYAPLPGVEIARCWDTKKKSPKTTCLFCKEIWVKKTNRYTGYCDKSIWPQYEIKRDAILFARRQKLQEEDVVDEIKDVHTKSWVKMQEAKTRKDEFVHQGEYVIALIMDRLDTDRLVGGQIKKLLEIDFPLDET